MKPNFVKFYFSPLQFVEDVDIQIVEMTESDLTSQIAQSTEDEVLHLQFLPTLWLLAPDLLTDFPKNSNNLETHVDKKQHRKSHLTMLAVKMSGPSPSLKITSRAYLAIGM